MRRLLVFLLTFASLIASSTFINQAKAEIIFFDDFNDGNADGWIPVNNFGGPAASSIWKVIDGRYGGRIEGPSTILDSVTANITSPNYVFEFDMYPIEGSDKNIDLRYRNTFNSYEIHFNNPGGGNQFNGGPPEDGWPHFTNFYPNNGGSYHFKIVLNNQKIQVFVDDSKIFDVVDSGYNFTVNEQIGLRIGTGAAFPTEVWFDNVKVSTIDETSLDVPLFKQIAEPWQSNVYDSADKWSPGNPTIHDWGCAMTSAAMVLKYHGLNKLPDSTDLDPGSLNTWLNSQKDGYVKTGWVNWLAISRLSKLAKQSGNNPGFTHDALEYHRVNGYDGSKLTQDLNNGIPGILEEPGHFVVAKGISNTTFTINDPFFDRSTLNDGYNNTFLALGRYIPSNTDLSYFMFSVEPEVSVSISDSNGSVVNTEEFIQNPIINPQNNTQNNGLPTKIIYVQKPDSDVYTISLSSNSPFVYHLDSYLYDQNGEVFTQSELGSLNTSTHDEFQLVFNKSDVNSSSNTRIITFQTTIDDVNEQRILKLIHDQFAKLLIASLKNAKKDYDAGRTTSMKKKLQLIKTGLIYAPSLFIKKGAKTILLNDVNSLLQNSTPSS